MRRVTPATLPGVKRLADAGLRLADDGKRGKAGKVGSGDRQTDRGDTDRLDRLAAGRGGGTGPLAAERIGMSGHSRFSFAGIVGLHCW